MMHFMDEIDAPLEAKLARYLREKQAAHGGWGLFPGSDFDLSCSVKAYYALKLAGDDPDAPHMATARRAITSAGGAARTNVLTRITMALFEQIPWRGVPFLPVEIVLLPRWFPFHLTKVSYWSRTVMVPLSILCSLKLRARNPRGVNIPRAVRNCARARARVFPRQVASQSGADRAGRVGASKRAAVAGRRSARGPVARVAMVHRPAQRD